MSIPEEELSTLRCRVRVEITADLETLWLLQREGVPVRSLWRLVTLDDQLSIAAQARELADTWIAGLADVSYQDVHLGTLCQTSLLYFFRDVLSVSYTHLTLPTNREV